MFYCRPCGEARGWPTEDDKLVGAPCGICGQVTVCFYVRSDLLPPAREQDAAEPAELTEEACVRMGGHCFESDGIVLASIPPQYPETCKHCGKKRVGTPQSAMSYRDVPTRPRPEGD